MCSILLSVAIIFFFQAEDGIRDLVRSRGLGDVYKRQASDGTPCVDYMGHGAAGHYVKMVHNGIEYAVMELSLIHI